MKRGQAPKYLIEPFRTSTPGTPVELGAAPLALFPPSFWINSSVPCQPRLPACARSAREHVERRSTGQLNKDARGSVIAVGALIGAVKTVSIPAVDLGMSSLKSPSCRSAARDGSGGPAAARRIREPSYALGDDTACGTGRRLVVRRQDCADARSRLRQCGQNVEENNGRDA